MDFLNEGIDEFVDTLDKFIDADVKYKSKKKDFESKYSEINRVENFKYQKEVFQNFLMNLEKENIEEVFSEEYADEQFDIAKMIIDEFILLDNDNGNNTYIEYSLYLYETYTGDKMIIDENNLLDIIFRSNEGIKLFFILTINYIRKEEFNIYIPIIYIIQKIYHVYSLEKEHLLQEYIEEEQKLKEIQKIVPVYTVEESLEKRNSMSPEVKKILVLCQRKTGLNNEQDRIDVDNTVEIINQLVRQFYEPSPIYIEYMSDNWKGDLIGEVDYSFSLDDLSPDSKTFIKNSKHYYDFVILCSCPFSSMNYEIISKILKKDGNLTLLAINEDTAGNFTDTLPLSDPELMKFKTITEFFTNERDEKWKGNYELFYKKKDNSSRRSKNKGGRKYNKTIKNNKKK